MADSTSESSRVVPLFPQETSEKPLRRRSSDGTGGGNYGPRITKLEKQVAIITTTLQEIRDDIAKIEKRTRYQNSPATHKEVLLWFGLFTAAIAAAYFAFTPIMIKANQNEDIQKLNENLSAIATEIHKTHK